MKLVKDVTKDHIGKEQEKGNLKGHPLKDHPEDIRNQMSLISDTDEILKFLEMAGSKSILNEHTINCRLTACHNLFPILNVGEDNVDYMLRNLDLLINRFRNKNTTVQASTLKVYKSRLKSTLEDFVAWSKDSESWERAVLEKANQTQREKKVKAAAQSAAQGMGGKSATAPAPRTKAAPLHSGGVSAPSRQVETQGVRRVSFPIRTDFNMEITLPGDGLSSKELLKLGFFLFPYCKDMDARDESWPLPN